MKSKTKIQKQAKKKTNLNLVKTIYEGKKNKAWLEVAGILASPVRNKKNLNIGEIEKKAEASKVVVIPGKVLSSGEIAKKIKIVALSFSEKAKTKIQKAGSTTSTILEEIKLNPEAKGIKILK